MAIPKKLYVLSTAFAMVTTLGLPSFSASAQTTPANPWPSNPNWQQYVLAPSSSNVQPVNVVSVSGDVTDANALVKNAGGTTTLSWNGSSPAPSILLDFGKDVGGFPYVNVASVSGSPTLRMAFSETQQYMSPTGDNGGFMGARYQDLSPTGPGTMTATLQGGERYVLLTLTSPGTVSLSGTGINFAAYRATPKDYQGWFMSSSDQLNKEWYSGAYTTQLDMVPPNVQGNSEPAILDGAKRDRLIWSGDVSVEGPTVYNSLGSNGSNYIKQSLLDLINRQNPDGELAGDGPVGNLPNMPSGFFNFLADYSMDYSMYTANDIVDYYRYTGDKSFAQQALPALQKEMNYLAGYVDSQGLLVTNGGIGSPDGAYDWDFYDGAKNGEVTAYNVIYYHTLSQMAYLLNNLGEQAQANQYTAQAQALKQAINKNLWDPTTGVYDISNQNRGPIAEDANVEAILYGVAPANKVNEILSTLKQNLWTSRGSEPFSPSAGYSSLISPFINGFEVDARFQSGDTNGALALLNNLWGPMVNTSNPNYTGAFWEKMLPNGNISDANASLAHGWASTPTSALSQYVLGIQPIDPGYKTWIVQPHTGNLGWAEGQVPTKYGPLSVKWGEVANSNKFVMNVHVPSATTGTIAVPVSNGRLSVIHINGQLVWSNGNFHNNAGVLGASSDGNYVYLTGMSGGDYQITSQVTSN